VQIVKIFQGGGIDIRFEGKKYEPFEALQSFVSLDLWSDTYYYRISVDYTN